MDAIWSIAPVIYTRFDQISTSSHNNNKNHYFNSHYNVSFSLRFLLVSCLHSTVQTHSIWTFHFEWTSLSLSLDFTTDTMCIAHWITKKTSDLCGYQSLQPQLNHKKIVSYRVTSPIECACVVHFSFSVHWMQQFSSLNTLTIIKSNGVGFELLFFCW